MPNSKGTRAPNGTWREWTSRRREQKRQAAIRWRSRHPELAAARRDACMQRRAATLNHNIENDRLREQRFRFGDMHGKTVFEEWLSLRSRSLYEMQRPTYTVRDAHGVHVERWETPDQLEARLRKEGVLPCRE